MEPTRQHTNGDIQVGTQKVRKRPERRACAQKSLSEKSPENDIMSDTRGEAVDFESLSKGPFGPQTTKRTAKAARKRIDGDFWSEKRSPKVHGTSAPAHGPENRKGPEMQRKRPMHRASAQKTLALKRPETDIMSDTRGETLA